MAETQVVYALRRRYGQTLGFIAHGEDRKAELVHFRAVMRMFKPDEDFKAIKPIRPYRPQRASWSATAFTILRKEGAPMTPGRSPGAS